MWEKGDRNEFKNESIGGFTRRGDGCQPDSRGGVPVFAEESVETPAEGAKFLDPPDKDSFKWVTDDDNDHIFSFAPVENATAYMFMYHFNNGKGREIHHTSEEILDSKKNICKVNAGSDLNWAESFLDGEKISGEVTIDVYAYQGKRENLSNYDQGQYSTITIADYKSTGGELEKTPQPGTINASLSDDSGFVLKFKEAEDASGKVPYMYTINFSYDGKEQKFDAYTDGSPYPLDLEATANDEGTITIPVTDYCRRTLERKLGVPDGGNLMIKVCAKSNARDVTGKMLYQYSDWTSADFSDYKSTGSVDAIPITGFDYSEKAQTKEAKFSDDDAKKILKESDGLDKGTLVLEVRGGTETDFTGYTGVTPFQMDLKIVSNNGEEPTKTIAETKKAIKVTVPIPKGLQDVKNIIVLRKHNDIVTQLFVDKIENGNISFYTDMFSNYAMVAVYEVTFDANGGSGNMEALPVSNGKATLTKNAFTRSGYTFTGWNTAADGSGMSYEDEGTVPISNNLTLYAQWKADAIPSHSGGGSAAPIVDRTTATNTVSDATVSAKSTVSDSVLSTAAKDLDVSLIDQAKTEADKKISSAASTNTANTAAADAEAEIKEITDRVEKAAAITDVSGSGDQKDAVQYGIVKGYIQGTSDTTFSPNGNVTRAQFVTFLYRLAGSPAVSGTLEFNDVKDNANLGGGDFAAAIQWASEVGIAKGFSDGSFKPGETVTREQSVAFLHRYFTNISGGVDNAFADVKDGAWYDQDISWGVGSGVVKGISATEFGVGNNTTRAQAAQFIYRAAVK